MILADFHLHTDASDGKLPIRELVDLYGKRGFGAIAVTDHLCETQSVLGKAARYLGYSLQEEHFAAYIAKIEEEAERAWRLYRMLVIPGMEITKNSLNNHRSAHVLGIGVRKFVNPCADIPEICAAIHAQGGLAVAAHPVSTQKFEKQTFHLWDRREELASSFDAWEVASGPYLFQEVLRSGLPMLANSDLHHPKQISSWKTVLQCENTEGAIFHSIRKQELSFTFYRDAESSASANERVSALVQPFPAT